MTVAADSWSH